MHCITMQCMAERSQLTVRIPPDLSRALARAARLTQRKRSDIVRRALSEYLATAHSKDRPADRARGLIGSLESGVPDLAEKHRRYIVQALRRGR